MSQTTKGKVHTILHPELGFTKWDKIVNGFIIILICLNVIVVILETVPSLHLYHPYFIVFDTVSVIIFTIEYLLRLWSSSYDPKYSHKVHGRLKYMFSMYALIDLVAILPFYIHEIYSLDLRLLVMLRLLRFLRLFRLTAYMKSARIVRSVFVGRANELKLSLVLILFLIVIAGCTVYFVEHPAQPTVFSSIPAALWWAVITVTSVGYGDMVPITAAGKIITSLISLIGLAIFALPAGIITAGFLDEMKKSKVPDANLCPHCGKPVNKTGII